MKLVPFRRIKLFKGPEVLARKPQAAGAPKEAPKGLPRRFLATPLPYFLLFVGLIGLLIAYLPTRKLAAIEAGAIASSDIVAPVDLTLEDQEATVKRRDAAEAAVLPVYFHDPNVSAGTENLIRGVFALGREALQGPEAGRAAAAIQKDILEKTGLELPEDIVSGLIRARFGANLEEGLVAVTGKVAGSGLILSKNLFLQGEAERGFNLIEAGGAERTARANEVLDLREAKAAAADEIGKLDLPGRAKNLLTELGGLLFSANITYSKLETEARRARARASVETVFYTIKRGKVIIRKGDEATPESVKLLGLINQSLEVKSNWASSFAGTAMLFALLFITLWYYLKSSLRRDQALQKFGMTGTILILSLLIYRLGAFLGGSFADAATWPPFANADVYTFAIPFQAGTLLFAFLAASEFTLVYAILNSLMVGYFLGSQFPPVIFAFVGGLAALYGVKYYQRRRRTAILRAGFFILAPVNIFVILTLHLIRDRLTGLDVLLAEVILGIVGAVLSAALAFVLLPIFETAFGLVTGNRLLELSNSDLPIFRRMAIEAPGTYHHSLLTATLAEKAAEEIKADSPLVKAAALYHDIGKLKRPEYFIENRGREIDAHKDLTPAMSTLVIISHVKEGLELSRQLRLPRVIREIVEQHHGTSLVRYFFQKAKEKYDPEQQTVGEESFRYPGPNPQTREAALVLLADSVEAASRSLRNPSLDSLKRVITDIVNGYLQDGQLDDCDFSLRELRAVATAFLSILYPVYHPRVDYPGFDFEMRNKKKKTNGHHPQPPA